MDTLCKGTPSRPPLSPKTLTITHKWRSVCGCEGYRASLENVLYLWPLNDLADSESVAKSFLLSNAHIDDLPIQCLPRDKMPLSLPFFVLFLIVVLIYFTFTHPPTFETDSFPQRLTPLVQHTLLRTVAARHCVCVLLKTDGVPNKLISFFLSKTIAQRCHHFTRFTKAFPTARTLITYTSQRCRTA